LVFFVPQKTKINPDQKQKTFLFFTVKILVKKKPLKKGPLQLIRPPVFYSLNTIKAKKPPPNTGAFFDALFYL
jgi:hypothetical protein